MIKKILFRIVLLSAVCTLIGACDKHTEVLFDTPFVSISDEQRGSSTQYISKDANNLLSPLWVDINVSSNRFTEDISIEYEIIVGDGLKEGEDFVIQSTTRSPLVFKKGTYNMPIRILWKKTPFDPEKNNTLEIKLVSSSLEDMLIGYPGPSRKRSTFTFIKQ